MPQSNVVISGLGVVSSIGIGCQEFFEALRAKRSGICSLAKRTDGHAKPGAVTTPAGVWIGGPILDFEPKQYVRPRKALKVMCREIQLAFAASQLAVEHAGLESALPAEPEGDLRPADVGTVFGGEMYYGPPTEMEEAIRKCIGPDGKIDESKFGAAAMKDIIPLWMLKYLPNMPACHVGIALNAHGPNNSLILGDVSGSAALIEAVSCLERGIAKVMVTGAAGTRINSTRMNYINDLPIPDAVDPIEMSSRPHTPDSKGVVGGEAAAALVLEKESEVEARNGRVFARVKSYAERFFPANGMIDGERSSRIDKEGYRGSAEAIRLAVGAAIADAGLTAGDVGMVVSHGMGDPIIDQQERKALDDMLPGVPLVAPIAALGHTGAACGTVGLIVGAMSLAQQIVPPTLNAESAGGCFRSEAEPLERDHVVCLCHTAEGNATAIVLGK